MCFGLESAHSVCHVWIIRLIQPVNNQFILSQCPSSVKLVDEEETHLVTRGR